MYEILNMYYGCFFFKQKNICKGICVALKKKQFKSSWLTQVHKQQNFTIHFVAKMSPYRKGCHILPLAMVCGQIYQLAILPCLPRMGFSEFAGKYARDPRYKAIDKMKDREALFNEFLKESKKRVEEESRNKSEKVWLGFRSNWGVTWGNRGVNRAQSKALNWHFLGPR